MLFLRKYVRTRINTFLKPEYTIRYYITILLVVFPIFILRDLFDVPMPTLISIVIVVVLLSPFWCTKLLLKLGLVELVEKESK